jgi:hypothetical protein
LTPPGVVESLVMSDRWFETPPEEVLYFADSKGSATNPNRARKS